MKRILFGIMALSVAAFAKNPGDPIVGNVGEASIPVKIIAEVLVPADSLVITDEAGNILTNGITLDHGVRTNADTNHTTAPFRFKVKRLTAGASAPLDGDLTVALDTKGDVANNQQQVRLGKVGSTAGSKDNLISTLALAGGTTGGAGTGKYGYKVTTGAGDTEHTGEITSTVSFTTASAGKYDSTADPSGNGTAELKVTLAAKGK